MKDTEKIREKTLRLKEKREAIILTHNYQLGEVQDIADFVGDSLNLSQKNYILKLGRRFSLIHPVR